MDKLFMILLVIGLASAHTFVKRDAPAGANTESLLESAKQQLDQLGGQMQKVFDPENITDGFKKGFNEFVDKLSDLADNLKPKENKQ